MLINEISPRKELAEFIRLYRIVDFHFPASIRVPDKAYPPRPEHCLQFQPLHKSEMFYPGRKGMIHNTSVPILVGQQTVLHYRQVPQVILAIQVVFQPATIYRWFGISTHEMNNRIVDADCLFGKEIHMVNERLGEAADYNKMISVIEIFLLNEARRVRKDIHAIDRVFRDFLHSKFPPLKRWLTRHASVTGNLTGSLLNELEFRPRNISGLRGLIKHSA